MARFNINDFDGLGSQPQEQLLEVLAGFQIKVPEHKNKSFMLAYGFNEAITGDKSFQFKNQILNSLLDMNNPNSEENLKKINLMNLIVKNFNAQLIEESKKIYQDLEKAKELKQKIIELISKEKEQKEKKQLAIAIDERMKFEKELQRILDNSPNKLADTKSNLEKEISRLQELINAIHLRNDAIFEKYGERLAPILDDYTDQNGANPFRDLPQDAKAETGKMIARNLFEFNYEINEGKPLDPELQKKLDESDHKISKIKSESTKTSNQSSFKAGGGFTVMHSMNSTLYKDPKLKAALDEKAVLERRKEDRALNPQEQELIAEKHDKKLNDEYKTICKLYGTEYKPLNLKHINEDKSVKLFKKDLIQDKELTMGYKMIKQCESNIGKSEAVVKDMVTANKAINNVSQSRSAELNDLDDLLSPSKFKKPN